MNSNSLRLFISKIISKGWAPVIGALVIGGLIPMGVTAQEATANGNILEEIIDL